MKKLKSIGFSYKASIALLIFLALSQEQPIDCPLK